MNKAKKVGNKFVLIAPEAAKVSTTDTAKVAKVKDADTSSLLSEILARLAALEGKK
jgi:hypothetical protein